MMEALVAMEDYLVLAEMPMAVKVAREDPGAMVA